MSIFKNNIAKTISNDLKNKLNIELDEKDILSYLEKPKNAEFGDIALPCFRFAKIMKKPPVKIAEELELLFSNNPHFENITNVNGFLNFKYSKEMFVSSILEKFEDNSFYNEIALDGEGKTMVIDFSSPNIAKKVHLGTFRSTAIGNAIQKIYKEKGWDVKRINHLGDWGTQFGKLMSAYKNWGNEEELKQNPMSYLQKIYVEFNKKSETDESLLDESRDWFLKLENGDEEALKLWSEFRKYTIEDLTKSYDRIGVKFDHFWGEAFYEKMLPGVIDEIEKSEISEISEGALIVDLEGYKMPPCLIRRSNGASIYATRDIAAAIYRYEQFKFDKMLYVIGTPQQLHCNQFFKVLELLDYEWSSKCEFVGFGQILGLSTRKGTAVYLDDIFDEARNRSLKIIEERKPDMENKEETAEKIGVGAVIFQDLSKSRIKDSEFNWERVLAFDGETGPYIQYTYVRIYNILEKIKETLDKSTSKIDYSLLVDTDSYNLISLISEYPKKLDIALKESEPFIISSYTISLSKAINRFYRNNKVVGAEENTLQARKQLLEITRDLLEKCMNIIGIPVITKM